MPEEIEDVASDPSTEEESAADEEILDDAEDGGDEEETPDDGEDEQEESDDESDADDLDAPKIPRRRFNEAIQKEREKRDAALASAGLRWDEETQSALPVETEDAEQAAPADSAALTEDEWAWFDMSLDEMAEDAQWRRVAEQNKFDLDDASVNEASIFRQRYMDHVQNYRRQEAAKEVQYEDQINAFYDGLDKQPELAGLGADTVKSVKDAFQVIFRKEAVKRGGRPSLLADFTKPALGLAVLENLDAIVAARGGQAVKAEKTRTRAIQTGQGAAPTPAKKAATVSLTPEQREMAGKFGMTPEQYAANMGD
jgi:hypothetical protein